MGRKKLQTIERGERILLTYLFVQDQGVTSTYETRAWWKHHGYLVHIRDVQRDLKTLVDLGIVERMPSGLIRYINLRRPVELLL